MAVLNHLRVSVENATGKYQEFDDKQSMQQSTVRSVQSCFEVEHNQHFKIVLTTLEGFVWPIGSNGLIVTLDFDEGIRVNRYEVALLKETIQEPSYKDWTDSTHRFTYEIESLVLPNFDIYQRFRLRFVEISEDESVTDGSSLPTALDFQRRIRIEVKRVKLEQKRNTTAPNFGEPRKVRRASKAGLRKKNITHEIDLVPTEELYYQINRPFRSISVEKGHVGIFLFRYSGVGILEKLPDNENETSEENEQEPQSTDLTSISILKDACTALGTTHISQKKEMLELAKGVIMVESIEHDNPVARSEQGALMAGPGSRSESTDFSKVQREVSRSGDILSSFGARGGFHVPVSAAVRTQTVQPVTRDHNDLVGSESSLLAEQLEVMESAAKKMKAYDEKLSECEKDITQLQRQIEKRRQEANDILQKRNKLDKKLENLSSRSQEAAACLNAELDRAQKRLDLKKRKVSDILDKQAALTSSKRGRDITE